VGGRAGRGRGRAVRTDGSANGLRLLPADCSQKLAPPAHALILIIIFFHLPSSHPCRFFEDYKKNENKEVVVGEWRGTPKVVDVAESRRC
jgi:hypothetical protein